jgi:hypothetical protein
MKERLNPPTHLLRTIASVLVYMVPGHTDYLFPIVNICLTF